MIVISLAVIVSGIVGLLAMMFNRKLIEVVSLNIVVWCGMMLFFANLLERWAG